MRETQTEPNSGKDKRKRLAGDTRKMTIKKRSNLFLFSLNALLCLSVSVCIVSEASIREDSLYKLRGKFLKSTDGSSTKKKIKKIFKKICRLCFNGININSQIFPQPMLGEDETAGKTFRSTGEKQKFCRYLTYFEEVKRVFKY